jgi:hypothetical protein
VIFPEDVQVRNKVKVAFITLRKTQFGFLQHGKISRALAELNVFIIADE